ncbi:sugar porter family MFS transporter [Flavobacterium quisquiliarum]|uniref:Sugar porter family MFS transporter n=1 Tax=Flavobacterium quisquiliarum TaxID=1834436 RepID=A0ABV8W776_9FLAO|nr:sugar porter family MFS transporter [Flavobacterium quisquiliarum]MBW1654101.1 sugar porter family MFS transporter [Flavobacterium quisquiliarum]NWL03413.1 MFS transporter [Flavobacterium collinsii]
MNQKENFKYIIFLSIIGAIGGFLFGYDVAVISGTIEQVSKQFALDNVSTGWYVGCALIGSIIGVAFAGKIADVLGRKWTMLLAATLFTISAAGCMFVNSFEALIWARILGGMGIGVASVVSPLYISEVSPARFRGTLVTLYQLAITVGIVASYFANAKVLSWAMSGQFEEQWAKLVFQTEYWRGMLGLCGIPSFLFFLIIFFIPESPRWQISKNNLVAAERTLTQLFGAQEAQEQIENTKKSISNKEKSDWRILFQPGYRTALFIGMSLAILGQFMGVNVIFYYGPIIFKEAGMASQGSLDFQIVIGVVNVLSTILGMYLVDKIGRKQLVYIGVTGMFAMLIAIGAYFYLQFNNPNILLYLIIGYIFFCAISICVVIWVLISEMYPVKVRGLAMSMAGFSLWIGSYLIGQLTPVLLESLSPAISFWIFAVMCIPYLLITRFYVPETTGKSLEEIEDIWIAH